MPNLEYPSGWILTVFNGHMLYDGPNRDVFCFFVPFTTDPDMAGIYGPSIINQTSGPQMALNKGFSQFFSDTELTADPILVTSSLSQGLNQDSNIRKLGATIVTAKTEGGASWLDPHPLGEGVLALINLAFDVMEDVSGVYEVAQGQTSQQARSGVAIDKLQTAAQTRSNMRSGWFEKGILTLYQNIISLFVDYVPMNGSIGISRKIR